MIFKDDPKVQVIDDSQSSCQNKPGVRCLYFDYTSDKYSVEKCLEDSKVAE